MLQRSHHTPDLTQEIYWGGGGEHKMLPLGEDRQEGGKLYKGHMTHGSRGNVSDLAAGNDMADGTEQLKVGQESTWFWNMGGSLFTNNNNLQFLRVK